MTRVLLVHWHEQECAERAERLAEHGYFVDCHWRQEDGKALTHSLTADPPAALVIDLARLPSHGRAIAVWLRERKALRTVPLVFVPGDAEKTARLKEAFPDATFAAWPRLAAAVQKAIANPVRDPAVPKTADYSGTPLPKKLGMKVGSRLCLLRAPKDFERVLGALPEQALVTRRLGKVHDVVVVFCAGAAPLHADFARAAAVLADQGSLWIAWPKKASGVPTDLDENVVRAFGLEQGLVDTKVCAIDAVWSGLRFSRRRAAKTR